VDEVVKHNTGESKASQPVMSDEELAHTIIAPVGSKSSYAQLDNSHARTGTLTIVSF